MPQPPEDEAFASQGAGLQGAGAGKVVMALGDSEQPLRHRWGLCLLGASLQGAGAGKVGGKDSFEQSGGRHAGGRGRQACFALRNI